MNASSKLLAKFLKKNGCKFLFEIPTCKSNFKEEDLSFVRTIFRKYSNIWSNKIKTMPDLYVFMGDGEFSTLHSCPAIKIENGIALDLVPIRNPKNEEDKINKEEFLASKDQSNYYYYVLVQLKEKSAINGAIKDTVDVYGYINKLVINEGIKAVEVKGVNIIKVEGIDD